MFYLELAVQGVRGFSPLARVHLKPGYWCLIPGGGGAAPLAGVLSALCYPDGRGGDVQLLAPGQKAGRIGVMFLGADQLGYRLVRDLGGSGSLQRVNEATGQSDLITRDANEMLQFLRGHVGMPPKRAFEQLYCFHAAQLPSRGPKGPVAAAQKSEPKPPLAAANVVEPAADLEEARARLAALEQEAKLSREVDELQFALDGVSSRLFELESTLQSADALRGSLAQADQAFEAAPSSQSLGLSPDILERVNRFSLATQRRDEALAKLEVEREQSLGVAVHVPSIWKNSQFLVALFAGFSLLVGGSLLSGYLRYLVLLDIPAFGLAALMALKHIEDLQAAGQVSRREEFLAAREKKVHEDYEREAAVVKSAFVSAGVESAEELAELLGRKAMLRDRAEELRRQLKQLESQPEFVQASARARELKAEQEHLNAQLVSRGGGYVRDLREVERELARVKESIAKAIEPRPAPPSSASPGEVEVFVDPTPALFELGADLFTTDAPSVGALIKDRAAQYLAALTDRRYLGIEFDKEGHASAFVQGRKIPAGELPPADLDWLYLSIRLALIEKFSARSKMPVIIEDLFEGLEAMKVPLLGRMLKHLGTLTQVLHATPRPLEGIADGSVAV